MFLYKNLLLFFNFIEYFENSTEIKYLQKSAVKVEGLQVEFRTLRGELREASSTINRLDATAAKVSDFSELLGRISVLSRMNDQVVEHGSSIKEIESRLYDQSKSVDSCTSELNRSISKQQSQSSEIADLRSFVDGLTRSLSCVEVFF